MCDCKVECHKRRRICVCFFHSLFARRKEVVQFTKLLTNTQKTFFPHPAYGQLKLCPDFDVGNGHLPIEFVPAQSNFHEQRLALKVSFCESNPAAKFCLHFIYKMFVFSVQEPILYQRKKFRLKLRYARLRAIDLQIKNLAGNIPIIARISLR